MPSMARTPARMLIQRLTRRSSRKSSRIPASAKRWWPAAVRYIGSRACEGSRELPTAGLSMRLVAIPKSVNSSYWTSTASRVLPVRTTKPTQDRPTMQARSVEPFSRGFSDALDPRRARWSSCLRCVPVVKRLYPEPSLDRCSCPINRLRRCLHHGSTRAPSSTCRYSPAPARAGMVPLAPPTPRASGTPRRHPPTHTAACRCR